MFKSKLHIVSVGIAAHNKPLDSTELHVIPIELTPFADGDVRAAIESVDASGINKDGLEYTVRVKSASALTASWFPFGSSNRVTPPDVRRNEHVLIWQYADVDKYYWTPMGMDDDLRRLETVIYAFSATKDEAEELDPSSNMYSLEVSTHGKNITLHTTTADGEPYEYTIQLDTGYGKLTVTDNIGNTITLDSPEHHIRAINTDLTEVSLNKTKLYGYASEDVTVRSDDTMTASSGGNMTVECEADMTVDVANDTTVTIGNELSIDVGSNTTLMVNGNVDCIVTGDVNIAASGNISMSNGSAGIKMIGSKVSIN